MAQRYIYTMSGKYKQTFNVIPIAATIELYLTRISSKHHRHHREQSAIYMPPTTNQVSHHGSKSPIHGWFCLCSRAPCCVADSAHPRCRR